MCFILPINIIFNRGEETSFFVKRRKPVLNCIVITDPPRPYLQLMQTVLKVNTPFVNGNDYGKLTTEPDNEHSSPQILET